MRPRGIAFDAFGTVFDLNALRDVARTVAGRRGGELFEAFSRRLVPSTWLATAAETYRPLTEIAVLELRSASRELGLGLDARQADEIASGLATLPAYDDAGPALRGLAGTPLAILSNGTGEGIESLVAGAGLTEHFEHLLVADSVRRFKPAPEVYELAVRAFQADPGSVLLVSGNEWDVAGAQLAGLRGAFVARGRPVTAVLGVEPDLVVEQLSDLPEAIPDL
ncbi:MAG TPA: haloacid dehalogenase type II [Thermoleophilaceae bacterium]|nr:haloacid dehalogenase type II [Thermoleophilaceae bacterium]